MAVNSIREETEQARAIAAYHLWTSAKMLSSHFEFSLVGSGRHFLDAALKYYCLTRSHAPKRPEEELVGFINRLGVGQLALPKTQLEWSHRLRRYGNSGAHLDDRAPKPDDAKRALEMANRLAHWVGLPTLESLLIEELSRNAAVSEPIIGAFTPGRVIRKELQECEPSLESRKNAEQELARAQSELKEQIVNTIGEHMASVHSSNAENAVIFQEIKAQLYELKMAHINSVGSVGLPQRFELMEMFSTATTSELADIIQTVASDEDDGGTRDLRQPYETSIEHRSPVSSDDGSDESKPLTAKLNADDEARAMSASLHNEGQGIDGSNERGSIAEEPNLRARTVRQDDPNDDKVVKQSPTFSSNITCLNPEELLAHFSEQISQGIVVHRENFLEPDPIRVCIFCIESGKRRVLLNFKNSRCGSIQVPTANKPHKEQLLEYLKGVGMSVDGIRKVGERLFFAQVKYIKSETLVKRFPKLGNLQWCSLGELNTIVHTTYNDAVSVKAHDNERLFITYFHDQVHGNLSRLGRYF